MFGFGKKKSSKKRDNVIGLIANIIDHILPEQGYDSFSSGYYFLRFLRILSMVETLIMLPSFFKDSTSLPSPSGA